MSLVVERTPGRGPARRGGPAPVALSVYAVAAAAALLWLPNVVRPLSSDEGGFLMVGSQWSPGTSLYGSYWVDRPPLIIAVFQLADLAGGKAGLRAIGVLVVVLSVLLAGRAGRLLAPRVTWAPLLTAATAGVFVTAPVFGASEVDGELLAVPWLLAGIVCVLQALASTRRSRFLAWWLVAGAAGMGAALIKQSMLDVFVVAGVVVLWLLTRRRYAAAGASALSFTLGALAMLGVVLGWAAAHGTDPAGLWDAVVVFRADAASVISSQANSATPRRAVGLMVSFLGSGALVVLAAAFLPVVRRGRGRSTLRTGLPDVRILAGAVLVWEAAAVAAGGSYWLHYLIGSVPGLVLATAAVAAHRPGRERWVVAALSYGVLATLVGIAGLVVHDRHLGSDGAVASYLATHRHLGDTGVVAFGNPAILEEAHLPSPYPDLWSLPVRVHDPTLTAFTRMLTGPSRPTWVVVNGTSLATWGVDASRAEPVLRHEYRWADTEGDYRIYLLRGTPRP